MNTKQQEPLPLRSATTPDASRPTATAAPPAPAPAQELTSLEARLHNFTRSLPLFLPVEGGKAHPQDLRAFAEHLKKGFPELRRLKGELQRTMTKRDELTRTLVPFLRGNYPQLAALVSEEAETDNPQRNAVIDHSARLLWELSQAEERFHALAEQVNALEAALEKAAPAPYQRFVRWALRQV